LKILYAKPQYAQELLRVWFIDKDTYMNPNLKYAETVRSKKEMNPSGMEGRPLTELTDAIRLLQHSPQWTEEVEI
jgi:unsaturated chondroitin disaccharide hydrolase